MQERRKQLGGGGEALKRQMEKVQDVARGPADELAKALSKSDFQKAAQALEKLQKQLADSQLDPAKKEELAKQLEQLKQKIDQMAQQAKDAQADLQKRADQMKQAGDPAAAGKLEDEIQKLQQQGPQMEALQNLANKLGQCCQADAAGAERPGRARRCRRPCSKCRTWPGSRASSRRSTARWSNWPTRGGR